MRSSENSSLTRTTRMNSKSLRSLSTGSGYIVPVFLALCRVLIEYLFPSLDIASIFFVPLGAGANTGRSGRSLKTPMASFSPISPTLKLNPLCLASLSIAVRSSRRLMSSRDLRSEKMLLQLLSLFFIDISQFPSPIGIFSFLVGFTSALIFLQAHQATSCQPLRTPK